MNPKKKKIHRRFRLETDEEVRELEAILEKNKFVPIESPLKRWFKALVSR